MPQELVSQREFVERYERGERNFSNVLMQFFDISDMKFSDIAFKGCKMLFCTFRNCAFGNMIFDNCDDFSFLM